MKKISILVSSFLVALTFLASQNVCGMDDKEEEAVANRAAVGIVKYRVCCQPDISSSPHSGQGEALTQNILLKWDNGTCLSYYFLKKYKVDEEQKDVVRGAFRKWAEVGFIGISFKEEKEESNADKSQIKIGFNQSDGSWSFVGKDALTKAKSMNFGWDLTTPYGHKTALHEIGHALGFHHEHQSPYSEIKWNRDAVVKYYKGPPNNWNEEKIESNILTNKSINQVRGSDFDPSSIMIYQIEPGLIESPEKYKKEGIREISILSKMDKRSIRQFYPPTNIPPWFLNGKLIYKPDPNSDNGKIELLIIDLQNPLEGTFDLSQCGDAGQYLSISTGYRKVKKLENKDKTEIWFTPRFLVENKGTVGFNRIFPNNWQNNASVGIIWTNGNWNISDNCDHLTNQSMDELSNNNLYEKWRKAHSERCYAGRYPLSHVFDYGSVEGCFWSIYRLHRFHVYFPS